MRQKLATMIFGIFVALLMFTLSSEGAKVKAQGNTIDSAFLSGEEARIQKDRGRTEIKFLIVQPERYTDSSGRLLVSIEVPKRAKISRSSADVSSWSTGLGPKDAHPNSGAVVSLQSFEIKDTNLPPGPNDDTTWLTFSRDIKDFATYTEGPLSVTIPIEIDTPINFTRIIIGKPSTPRSMVIGAFAPQVSARKEEQVIVPGMDYLGTVTARQHFRIPADTLAPATEAFDEMVDFGDAPFEPEKNNIDTVMLRLRPIHVGETTPVRLLRFMNRSKNPIKIHSKSGSDLYYTITARLSPNARSGGFITVLPDGTYRSTTTLTPMLEFQRVENGNPVGDPIFVDTAVSPIVGFPFYLASNGGKWMAKAPQGRLTNSMTSNFFYNNGPENAFIHSNGPGPGVVGKCSKASAALQ